MTTLNGTGYAEKLGDIAIQERDALTQLQSVNLDEVSNEAVRVKVAEWKEEEILDSDGHPLLDEEGKPLRRRRITSRIAEIYDLVPLPLYNKMIKMRDQITKGQIAQSDAIEPMGDCVLEVWKLSEPWMTKERLMQSVPGDIIAALFVRFFNKSRHVKQ